MRTTLIQLLLIFSIVNFSYSQDWEEKVKLEAIDQQGDDNLGSSVAISGNYAIAGAWHEDHIEYDSIGTPIIYKLNAGAAYIYHYDETTMEWTQQAKLVAPDRATDANFGVSVGISGTYAVVGTHEDKAAYVFEKNDSDVWVMVKKLDFPGIKYSDRFGHSVAISESTIVVGAFHEDEDENDLNTKTNAGAVYIFNRVTGIWGLSQKLIASDRDGGDYFGYSVAISDDLLIVGAYHRDTDTLAEYGGAYVFVFDGTEWLEEKILEPIDKYYGDRFGWSVDVDGSYFIVGAPYHDYDDDDTDPKNNAGAAYIFDRDNSWAADKVVGGDRTAQDNVGEDVAIYGTTAVVGAPLQDYDTDGDPPYWGSGGAAFVYEKANDGFWNQSQKLLADDRFTSDKFGHSVDIEDGNIICGAVEDNSTAGPSTGAVYIFNKLVTTSIESSFSLSEISVYPNPSASIVNIDFTEIFEEVMLNVVDLNGKIIERKYVDGFTNQLDVSQYVPGMYLLHLMEKNGAIKSISIIKTQ